MRNHTVVVGYGTKGRTASAAMISDGAGPTDIVVVDTNAAALDTRQRRRAGDRARRCHRGPMCCGWPARSTPSSIIVATNRDDTAVLVTLTARELAPNAKIIAAMREAENQHLLQQSGADTVVVSSETAGRLLGIATKTPSVVEMIEDLLTPGSRVRDRRARGRASEVGGSPRHLRDIVLGVVRDGQLLRVDAPEADAMETRRPAALRPQCGR